MLQSCLVDRNAVAFARTLPAERIGESLKVISRFLPQLPGEVEAERCVSEIRQASVQQEEPTAEHARPALCKKCLSGPWNKCRAQALRSRYDEE